MDRALHERTSILEKAKTEAEAIRREAEKNAQDLHAKVCAAVRSEAGRIRERRYNSILFQMNARRYRLKAQAIENIWCTIEAIIWKIEGTDFFRHVLETLFLECIADVPDGSVVRANPVDAELVRTYIERSGRSFGFGEDPSVHGGIAFYWPDGKTVLNNTLSHRLARLKVEGNADISWLLFGSEGDGSS